MSNSPNINIPNRVKYQVYLYGFIGIVIVIVLLSLAKKLGLIFQEKKPKEIIEEEIKQVKMLTSMNDEIISLKKSPYFDISLYTKLHPSKRLDSAKSLSIAEQVDDSMGFINDDESILYDAFRKIPTKTLISQVANSYSNEFNSDMLGDLFSSFSDEELRPLVSIINSKPE